MTSTRRILLYAAVAAVTALAIGEGAKRDKHNIYVRQAKESSERIGVGEVYVPVGEGYDMLYAFLRFRCDPFPYLPLPPLQPRALSCLPKNRLDVDDYVALVNSPEYARFREKLLANPY